MIDNQQEKDKNERQIEAILKLSLDKNYTKSIKLSPQKGDDLMDVYIDPNSVKKPVNWSRRASFTAILVFIASIFVIENPVSVNLFWQLSIFGLFLILFGDPLSKYTGNMWWVGRIGTRITESSPAFLVKFMGWIFLFMPIIYKLLS